MRLRAISIQRLPGIRPGFELVEKDLAGSVRVIHGPNGIGKSSLLRALKALLWPKESLPREHVELEARFEIDGAEWTVRREGLSTRWTCGGSEVSAPQLPAWTHARQMLVGLADLGQGAEIEDLQDHLQRELGGGFDLSRAEEALRPGSQAGRPQAKALSSAEASLRQARDAQDAVVRESTSLDGMQRELEQARVAQRRLAQLQAARNLAHAQRDLHLAQAELARFPDGLERLHGSEGNDVDTLRERLERRRKDSQAAHEEEARLTADIGKLDLQAPIPTTQLDELTDRVDELRRADEELQRAREEHARTKGAHDVAAGVFGAGADLDLLASLDESLTAEVEAFLRRADALAKRRNELEARHAALGAHADAEPPAARAVAALEDWLATPGPPAAAGTARRILLALAALVVVLAGALAFVHPAFLALVLLAVVAFIGARSTRGTPGPTRAAHEASYSMTLEPPPVAWSEDAVRARLGELRLREARAAANRNRQDVQTELEAKRQLLEADEQELAEQRAPLTAAVGTSMSAPDGALLSLVSARLELRKARLALGVCDAAMALREQERAQALAGLNATLALLGGSAVANHASAKARVTDMRQRSAALDSLLQHRAAQRELARREEAQAVELEAEIAALFRRSGLEPGDDGQLAHRLEQLDAWRAARRRWEDARRDVERLKNEVVPELAGLSLERIEHELATAGREAETVDERANRVTEVKTRLQAAKDSRALEDALATRDACRRALEEAFTKARRGALACALIADVHSSHEQDSKPRLVEWAGALFRRFTHFRFQLGIRLHDGKPALLAHDAQNAAHPFELDELSDGTRAQVLLAARLAYLREVEGVEPLPVVLDDALATSDPARKQEIGAALLEAAREQGRQFLVLTTDAADVELLRPVDARPGDVEATDLVSVRAVQAPVAQRERLRVPDVSRVPAPQGEDAAAYAARLDTVGLSVSPADPRRPVEDLHLWWVLAHDLALLHQLLEHRFTTVGELRNAGRAGLAVAGERAQASAAPWIELARGVFEAWRIGRGRPIGEDDVRELVSASFAPKLTSLARELDGDAKAWLAALERRDDERTKGYHSSRIKEHRERLVETGHLDPRDVLTKDEAWMRVLAAFPEPTPIPPAERRQRFDLLWSACQSA
jgi:energy-coupling factor transporter ATP-binding protein EcfA2